MYEEWQACCDTLHAHTQVLGKIATATAPPEPQLQHGALRLTARGWETAPLPSPSGTGAFLVVLDLQRHEVLVEASGGARRAVALTPNRPVGEVTGEVLSSVKEVAGPLDLDLTPQEVSWTVPLDQDEEHAVYDPAAISGYFAMATEAALVLAAFRAPFRGRATPVNAWWGSFDLAVNLFSGEDAAPPSEDFIMRNAMDSQEFAFGWWPGDGRYAEPAFYAYAHPAPETFAGAELNAGAARWEDKLGEYVLDWKDYLSADAPRSLGVQFARSAFRHTCAVCGWDPQLAASAELDPLH